MEDFFNLNPPEPKKVDDSILRRHVSIWTFIIICFAVIIYLGIAIDQNLWLFDNSQDFVPTNVIVKHGNNSAVPSDWKTYSNSQYGFEFRYPNNWMTSNTLEIDTTFYITGPQKGYGDVGGDLIDFEVSSNNAKLSLSDWIKNNIGFEGTDEKITIDGADGIKRTGIGQISGDQLISVFFSKGDKIFSFSVVGSSNISIQNQILSTFKFIEPINTSTWKTYTNSQYGFEFKYPSDWIMTLDKSGFPFYLHNKNDKLEITGSGEVPFNAIAVEINNVPNLSFDQWVNSNQDFIYYEKEHKTVDGRNSYLVKQRNDLMGESTPVVVIQLSKNVLVFKVLREYLISIFDQILSTIKFTK